MNDLSDEAHAVVEAALGNLWGVVNELARLRPARPKEYRVSIFGSARAKPGTPAYGKVKELAKRLAAGGCTVVTGGGPGLMQAANEGEREGDPGDLRRTIGIRVDLPFEQHANPFVEEAYLHRTFFSRLHQFVRLSNAYVVVDGGIGTTLETLMVWQLLQVKHIERVPLVLVGPMWRGLVDWARAHMLPAETPLANAPDLELPTCVATVEEAAAVIEADVARFQAARGR